MMRDRLYEIAPQDERMFAIVNQQFDEGRDQFDISMELHQKGKGAEQKPILWKSAYGLHPFWFIQYDDDDRPQLVGHLQVILTV